MYPPSTARERPEALAYVMAGSSAGLTYGELDQRSNQLARYWFEHGVRPGDTVMLVMANNPAWPIAMAAGMRSGLYVNPVNRHLRPAELAAVIGDARPAAIVTDTALAGQVAAAVDSESVRGQRPPLIVTVDGPAPGCVWLTEALQGQSTEPLDTELLGARVLYSGGTTGRPKRFAQPLLGIHPADAPQRHQGLVDVLDIGSDTVFLSPAPNYHAAPFTFQLITLAAGGTVVCMDRFDAGAALRAIVDHDVTHSQWVPTMLLRMLRLPDRARIPLSPRHRVAFTSGAPCPPHLKESILEWWGPILHEYYGASEGYGQTHISPAEAVLRPGSVGRPVGTARVRVVDADGDPVAPGVDGTVCFESAADPSRPGPPTLKHMGDIGHLDADGYLYLVGRHGFLIISGGVNIYPDEVEAALLMHPGIADVAVFGVPDSEFGESVKAVIERRAGSAIGTAEVIAHAREHLAHFKVPRSVQFTTDLPRLPTGKIDKRGLAERFGPDAAGVSDRIPQRTATPPLEPTAREPRP